MEKSVERGKCLSLLGHITMSHSRRLPGVGRSHGRRRCKSRSACNSSALNKCPALQRLCPFIFAGPRGLLAC